MIHLYMPLYLPKIINKYEMRVLIRNFMFWYYILGTTITLINGLVVKHDIVKKYNDYSVHINFMLKSQKQVKLKNLNAYT